ncbi:DUF3301 domain-containing protein [Bowmanella denitrificans]|uniref:DUF3301 domain-containing protein n=1 Tax=Bowmanella denitrificans TaxID=366582 RepID=UPI000C9A6F46|nr:DUF3301 domain-containing protein [Bowmanella denitrificans]
MNLADLLLMMVILALAWQFWRVRAMSEKAYGYLQDYCNKQGLQLISLSRRKTRIRPFHGKLDWYCEFDFEFSGNGEDAYQGSLIMRGMQVTDTQLPPYRV